MRYSGSFFFHNHHTSTFTPNVSCLAMDDVVKAELACVVLS